MKRDYCQLHPSYLDPHLHSNISRHDIKKLLKTFSKNKKKRNTIVRVSFNKSVIECEKSKE